MSEPAEDIHAGKRIGLIAETHGEGVDAGVRDAVENCAAHLSSLGATVEEVGPGKGFRQQCQNTQHRSPGAPSSSAGDLWTPAHTNGAILAPEHSACQVQLERPSLLDIQLSSSC